MQGMSSFYLVVNVLLAIYACYSWYWQARLELRGKFRISVLIWTLLIIWLGFSWNYIEKGDPGINVFLALLLFVSIIDGCTGFAPKRAVVSGYFKRTVAYSDISKVFLINIPTPKKPSVICLLGTKNGRQYNLQFQGQMTDVINTIKKYIDHDIEIEIKDTF
ncbi:hypothetical protein [Lactobacillus kalixensis]|nr:hypothetical protein [Lactobacillus kalixensis]